MGMSLGFGDEAKRVSSVTGDDLPALTLVSYGYGRCNFRFVTLSKNHPDVEFLWWEYK
jgi:hypothetical protein